LEKERIIITIDGPSGAGKTTVSRMLAARLGFRYVDTGALYRALAWWIREQGIDPEDDRGLAKASEAFPFSIGWADNGSMRVRRGDTDITHAIRTEAIGMLASRISARPVVREALWRIQRELGQAGRLVFEGRDMGSQVFPDADLRFYVTAAQDERARRRFEELREAGQEVALETVRDQMALRDEQDSARTLAPLKIPEGALVIDTTGVAVQEVVGAMMEAVRKRFGAS
jgi:cytidylate kinase